MQPNSDGHSSNIKEDLIIFGCMWHAASNALILAADAGFFVRKKTHSQLRYKSKCSFPNSCWYPTYVLSGEIPSWIDGSLFRNGPGKYELGDQQVEHLFDGLSVVHRFHITNGQVSFAAIAYIL